MKNKFLTLWLSLLCIIVFALQSAFPKLTDFLLLNKQSFPEIYRFITSIFLHASLQHLVLNLFALILFGLILEKLIGSYKLLFVFLFSGTLANLISVFFYPASLGASGAIFGIIGCLTILKPGMTVWTYSLPMPMFLAAILWAAADLLGIFYPSGVGNLAHLSGLFSGLIIGLYLRIKYFRKQNLSYSENRMIIPESYMKNWEDKFLKN